MFPRLCETFKELVPEIYFGGDEIPPYLSVGLPEAYSLEEIVSAIRSFGSGSNSCGFIDAGAIYYHLDNTGHFQIDRSKEFIFLGDFTQETQTYHPSSFALLQFLQDPCRRVLFVNRERAVYIEKTPVTYALCTELDWVWEDIEASQLVMEAVDSGIYRDKVLALLMKTFENRKGSTSSEMWEFWATFRFLLMQERLKLNVRQIDHVGGTAR
jgi:hypothetical protein